jgi:hypothetical protein
MAVDRPDLDVDTGAGTRVMCARATAASAIAVTSLAPYRESNSPVWSSHDHAAMATSG